MLPDGYTVEDYDPADDAPEGADHDCGGDDG